MGVILSWSGGKDSALALRSLMSRGVTVETLLTTVTEGYDRVSMHGVRRKLLHDQASFLGLRLEEVWIPKGSSNTIYERRMKAALERYLASGVTRVAFGDLFLEDIRSYREKRLAEVGMEAIFPLWHRDTQRLARQFIKLGFRAVTCCIDPRQIPKEFCGVPYDDAFLAHLPDGADPCGEKGEFHTFVFDGPLFSRPVKFDVGKVVLRHGFYFADLV